jgi:hypothetical protein
MQTDGMPGAEMHSTIRFSKRAQKNRSRIAGQDLRSKLSQYKEGKLRARLDGGLAHGYNG